MFDELRPTIDALYRFAVCEDEEKMILHQLVAVEFKTFPSRLKSDYLIVLGFCVMHGIGSDETPRCEAIVFFLSLASAAALEGRPSPEDKYIRFERALRIGSH